MHVRGTPSHGSQLPRISWFPVMYRRSRGVLHLYLVVNATLTSLPVDDEDEDDDAEADPFGFRRSVRCRIWHLLHQLAREREEKAGALPRWAALAPPATGPGACRMPGEDGPQEVPSTKSAGKRYSEKNVEEFLTE